MHGGTGTHAQHSRRAMQEFLVVVETRDCRHESRNSYLGMVHQSFPLIILKLAPNCIKVGLDLSFAIGWLVLDGLVIVAFGGPFIVNGLRFAFVFAGNFAMLVVIVTGI